MRIGQGSQSICPECGRVIEAFYESEGDVVWFVKLCPQHGEFRSRMAEDEKLFLEWFRSPVTNIPLKTLYTPDKDEGCPYNCGPCQEHLQTPCCVLLEVTQDCNQHCPYCFADSGKGKGDDPTFARVVEKLRILRAMGEERSFNLQISGGEPTLREDLPDIIRAAREEGFEFIQINTNGQRLALEPGYALKLKGSGASVIFLQFDGTRDGIYQELRGEPLFRLKQEAIQKCREAGLPVTLAVTVTREENLSDLGEIFRFLLANLDVVKGMHLQPAAYFGRIPEKVERWQKRDLLSDRVTLFELMEELEKQSGGALSASHFYPLATGHPLCSFSATYQQQKTGEIQNIIGKDQAEASRACCGSKRDSLQVIRQDRDFVVSKWHLEKGASIESGTFDEYLKELYDGMFTVSAMAFMDRLTLDTQRLRRCRVHILSEDDRLVPFCSYNTIHREKEMRKK